MLQLYDHNDDNYVGYKRKEEVAGQSIFLRVTHNVQ